MTNNIYQNALNSQSACNLNIVKQLAADLDEIWGEARSLGLGTDYVNTHPVVRLYIEQMVHLNRAGTLLDIDAGVPGATTYSKSYHRVANRAEQLDQELNDAHKRGQMTMMGEGEVE